MCYQLFDWLCIYKCFRFLDRRGLNVTGIDYILEIFISALGFMNKDRYVFGTESHVLVNVLILYNGAKVTFVVPDCSPFSDDEY